ncbi:chromate transporter [Petrotoga miotherma DSM 10691]|uniref:Chromate transporter n=2 Tax=Petrotoga TaxID=28236 RepID=A0A2K1PB04_9BACT|nr:MULTISPECIES: chromate transporter [Petrotoga]MDN5345628.1 chromate transporter [Petrotoga sp.]PNR99866.1 chromate transporter [Petrotoga miotherma DSM 10691]POZ93558.1 chromate transporter [Petrotoga halophila DSM 16923]
MKTLFGLFFSFFEIGLFGFGGGYAMIPLIQTHLERRDWMSIQEFLDLIAIAEVTPGPIAVNSATFVGYKVSGVVGSLVATTAVILPSLIIGLLVGRYFKNGNGDTQQNILKFLKPAVIGLILGSAYTIGIANIVNLESFLIFIGVLMLLFFTKLNPIFIIIMTGVVGIIFY